MKRHKIVRYTLLLIISVIGIWFTPNRNIQHLLCAIVMPQLYIEASKFKMFRMYKHGYLLYLSWCIIWELYQLANRGYLQIDQLTSDVIGIVLSYIIFGVLVMKVTKRDSLQ